MTALLAATFLLLQLLCPVFAADGAGCEPPSGYVAFPEYNAAYKIHRDDVPWTKARDRCVAEGAHLAVITSVEKMKRIVDPTILDSETFMYIGIHRSADTHEWVRVDNGLPVTSITFSLLDADDESACVVIWKGAGGSFTDYECNSYLAFVCETSIPEGCPSPVGHQN